jgi:predicted NBD/HSP70 family sugar kinase
MMTMNTADHAFVRKHNQQILLQEIIKRSPISRAELSELTHLNKATVSSQIASLIEGRLVDEIGQGQANSTGGRRPVMLAFNRAAGCAVGVDMGVNYIRTVLTDLNGQIIFEQMISLKDPSFAAACPQLIDQLHELIRHAPQTPYGIIGIGIGIHGFVDHEQKIIFTPNSKWDHVDLKHCLQNEFDCPILLTNEANAGAYGEQLFGTLQGCRNGVFVSSGIGLGVGLILDGKLFSGSAGLAGELGHMTIDLHGEKCHCGNSGCWELYTSENTFLHHLSELKKRPVSNIEEALELIHRGDADALNVLERMGYYLGLGVNNIINIFDPELVTLKGDLVSSSPLVLETVKRTVAARAFKHVTQHCRIVISALGKDATAVGGASFAIQEFLTHREPA